jgi:hypothetical protein
MVFRRNQAVHRDLKKALSIGLCKQPRVSWVKVLPVVGLGRLNPRPKSVCLRYFIHSEHATRFQSKPDCRERSRSPMRPSQTRRFFAEFIANDPFHAMPSRPSAAQTHVNGGPGWPDIFIKDTVKALQSIGQIASYIAIQMDSQYRIQMNVCTSTSNWNFCSSSTVMGPKVRGSDQTVTHAHRRRD